MIPAPPRPLPWAALALASVLAACALGWWVLAAPAVDDLDMLGVRAVNTLHSPATDALARGIDVLFGPMGSAIVWILAVLAALLLRGSRAALWTGLVAGVPWAASRLVKELVRRERPDLGVLDHVLIDHPASASFPSGHTAFAAALATTLVLALPPGGRRRIAVAAGALLVLAVAWSRMALGVHHPSDVLTSMILMPVLALCTARLLAAAGLPRPLGADRGPARARCQAD
ncbi:phosphatase PAP2 family protein [Brachybacterium phenoliresistens]|uniref:Phosphatidic acid phosphatase type 2/haloperoxidase domain-containing protein n=1 Tax=Brachybacterium phenoliresistens TaxID=396014 RepID=Z9JSW4_9MICO|nr:phosphatase PAP2 family protein [Brachybacterium phenoliresistens]EWS80891.1 hypothetical protein BF93_00535 [Brachybacterium phenoliresistens]